MQERRNPVDVLLGLSRQTGITALLTAFSEDPVALLEARGRGTRAGLVDRLKGTWEAVTNPAATVSALDAQMDAYCGERNWYPGCGADALIAPMVEELPGELWTAGTDPGYEGGVAVGALTFDAVTFAAGGVAAKATTKALRAARRSLPRGETPRPLPKPQPAESALRPSQVVDAIDFDNLTLTETIAGHMDDLTKAGVPARPYTDSRLLVEEITRAVDPIPDPQGLVNGWRWDVPGSLISPSGTSSSGVWELVIDLDTNQVMHLMFRSGS